MYLYYIHIYVYAYKETMKKDIMSLMEYREGYKGGFEKGMGRNKCCNHIINMIIM